MKSGHVKEKAPGFVPKAGKLSRRALGNAEIRWQYAGRVNMMGREIKQRMLHTCCKIFGQGGKQQI